MMHLYLCMCIVIVIENKPNVGGNSIMVKKIINVKYQPSAIMNIDADDLGQMTADIKNLIGDDYHVIFSPFDFQEVPSEGLFTTVEDILNILKKEGRDKDIIKLAEIVNKFIPAEAQTEGESDENPEPKYHQCDCDCSPESGCKVIDCDA